MAGVLGLDELFEGRHFDRAIIVLCVRWYLRFKLNFRDLVEMMAERGLSMAHTTLNWLGCKLRFSGIPLNRRLWNTLNFIVAIYAKNWCLHQNRAARPA
jgi:hypothetical protein